MTDREGICVPQYRTLVKEMHSFHAREKKCFWWEFNRDLPIVCFVKQKLCQCSALNISHNPVTSLFFKDERNSFSNLPLPVWDINDFISCLNFFGGGKGLAWRPWHEKCLYSWLPFSMFVSNLTKWWSITETITWHWIKVKALDERLK